MRSPAEIAARFEAIDAHDDTAEGFAIIPGPKRGGKTIATFTLLRHWEGTRRLLTFTGCANVELQLDADVLRGNAPSNTCSLEATTDSARIEALMRKQKRSWNVSSEPNIDPLPPKMARTSKLVLFKVRLFGGNALLVASNFSIKRLS